MHGSVSETGNVKETILYNELGIYGKDIGYTILYDVSQYTVILSLYIFTVCKQFVYKYKQCIYEKFGFKKK